MGLFGSKDEITEEQTKDNNTSDKPHTNPSERFAPYNIDSDSETYDTEALSIMDINDIIGVQADTPEDSTLESEFAALSEVITDSKDEFVPQLQNPNDCKESVNISDNKPRSERIQDAASKGNQLQYLHDTLTLSLFITYRESKFFPIKILFTNILEYA